MSKQEALALKRKMEEEAASLQVAIGKITYTSRGWLVKFRNLQTGGGFSVPDAAAWEEWKHQWRSSK